MKSIVLVAAIVASGLAAACSSAPDYSGLQGGTEQDQAPVVAAPTPPVTTTTSPSTQPTPLPVPPSGPGSTQSSARQFFMDKVYPSLNTTCASCHATGANGAPVFLQSNAATAYQTMDGRGMIQSQSVLLTKGQHLGPAMSATQLDLVKQWLDLEAKERVGQAAPVNILDKIGGCLSQGLFDAIGFEDLKTTPRQGEDPNTCTGCNNTPCSHCHTGGDGNFYMAVGSGIDNTTFEHTKQAQYIVKYIGLNGTQPVASNALALKSQSTQTDAMYLHPMFKITPQMQAKIDQFVQSAIVAYNQNLCGK